MFMWVVLNENRSCVQGRQNVYANTDNCKLSMRTGRNETVRVNKGICKLSM